jgi:hypothetical protein
VPDFKVKSRAVMSKAAKLDKMMEKKRFHGDSSNQFEVNPFNQKVQTINFNLNDDCVNGIFEID